MTNDNKKAVLTDENRVESAKLRQLWHARNRGSGRLNQADFGHQYGIGTQAAVSACLNGTMAISLKAALGFAKGLKCNLAEFSPRLAAVSGAVTQTSISALMHDLAPQLRHLTSVQPCSNSPAPGAAYTQFAVTLAQLFDTLPQDETTRAQAFMTCASVIQAAAALQQCAPPTPTPCLPAPVKTPT